MYVSHTLSRASLPSSQVISDMQDYPIYQLTNADNLLYDITDRVNDDNVFVTNQRLEQIKREMAKNITL